MALLRPTESMVVFLQQLGRGLRLHDGKDCLTVLDFLANYRRAHFKLPFLVGEQGEDTASAGAALRLLQQWQATGTAPASVPENVRIELEPLALAALRESLRTASPLRELVLADLQELTARLGRMPTLVEVHRLGRYGPRQCMRALECRRWAEVAQRLDLATDAERTLDAAAGDFLGEVERTAMTSSAASPAIQGGVKSAGMRQQPVQCGHSNSFSCNLRCIESADRSRKLHLMVIKAFRFQLRTKPGIERTLRRFAGSCRWVWNAAIAEQRRRRGVGEKFAGYAAMCRWLTEWRHAAGTAWLADTPIHPLQQTLRRLEAAYQRFFAAEGGHPRFKRRGQEPGLRFPDPKQFALDAGNARVKLPKLGWLRMRQSRPVPGVLKNASITTERGKWFVALQVELPDVLPSTDVRPTLGIDLGVALFAALSDGRTVEPLNALKQQQRRLKHAQRAVSRKQKNSRNRRKAVDRLGRLHSRIAAQRNDWLHKLTTELADQHPMIAIEDLKVAAMSASAAGTAQAPGKRVRQKAGLNRAILDQGWAEFRRQLEYKCAARGGAVVAVNPAHTSQTCSRCGCVDAGNRRTQALFSCLACGHAENADVNAARSILAAGSAAWAKRPAACGEAVSPPRKRRHAPVKQEPTEGSGA